MIKLISTLFNSVYLFLIDKLLNHKQKEKKYRYIIVKLYNLHGILMTILYKLLYDI